MFFKIQLGEHNAHNPCKSQILPKSQYCRSFLQGTTCMTHHFRQSQFAKHNSTNQKSCKFAEASFKFRKHSLHVFQNTTRRAQRAQSVQITNLAKIAVLSFIFARHNLHDTPLLAVTIRKAQFYKSEIVQIRRGILQVSQAQLTKHTIFGNHNSQGTILQIRNLANSPRRPSSFASTACKAQFCKAQLAKHNSASKTRQAQLGTHNSARTTISGNCAKIGGRRCPPAGEVNPPPPKRRVRSCNIRPPLPPQGPCADRPACIVGLPEFCILFEASCKNFVTPAPGKPYLPRQIRQNHCTVVQFSTSTTRPALHEK